MDHAELKIIKRRRAQEDLKALIAFAEEVLGPEPEPEIEYGLDAEQVAALEAEAEAPADEDEE